ncbi:MAG: serine/threonine-protein kinase [Myxococcota bacterium]
MSRTETPILAVDTVKTRTANHLATMAGVFLLSLTYYVAEQQFSGQTATDGVGASLVATTVAFALGAVAVRWLAGSLLAVNAIAVLAIFFGCVGFAWTTSLIPRDLRPELTLTLVYSVILLSRSALVPERPRTTLVIGAAHFPPLLCLSYFIYLDYVPPEGYVPLTSASVTVFVAFLWCVIVFVAWSVSRVIYSLRREVTEAKQLGQYTIEERLGGGGMGHVYRATHGLLQRPTALKLIRFSDAKERESLTQRFEHEVKLTALLTHPNTITVFDYGRTEDGVFYYAMELLNGASLQQIVEIGGPMEPPRALHVIRQAAAALTEAHAMGLIHRDIKPANIMLAKLGGMHDVVKVLDFGLVKRFTGSADAEMTLDGSLVGTPHYMAPESAAGNDVNAQSDVYALGAVLYFLLSGQTVFSGKTPVEVIGHHLHSPVSPPSSHSTYAFPSGLDELVMACLEKEPTARPNGAAGVLEALTQLESALWTERNAHEWWDEFGDALHRAVDDSLDIPTILEKRAG